VIHLLALPQDVLAHRENVFEEWWLSRRISCLLAWQHSSAIWRKRESTMTQQQNSEVAQLMAQIAAEREAALRGIQGLAEGTAKHKFIEAHTARMWALKNELGKQVGEKEALTIVCNVMLEGEP
jgi:hypothetical protein